MTGIDKEGTNDISIFDRKRVELSGIYDVVGFTDTAVIATCKSGNVSIDGEELKITCFDSSTGKLTVTGSINGVFYYGGAEKKSKRRLFG